MEGKGGDVTFQNTPLSPFGEACELLRICVEGEVDDCTAWNRRTRRFLKRFASSETTESGKWVVWSHEHGAYWPESRCGYVPLHAAGHFTFAEALAIVRQGNWGMGSNPEETMMPAPGRPNEQQR